MVEDGELGDGGAVAQTRLSVPQEESHVARGAGDAAREVIEGRGVGLWEEFMGGSLMFVKE